MLSSLRRNAGSLLIKIVLGLIAVVFVFWGVGSFRDQGGQPVAVVNGTPIAYETFARAYDRLLENYRRSFGDNLNEDLLKMLNVRRQAMNQVVDQQLMLDEARRLELQVTDEELATAIRTMPVFQIDGRFDNSRYQRVLSASRLSPEGFEFLQRESLLLSKLQGFVASGVKVSGIEAREWYDWQEAQVSIDYLMFDPASYTDIELTDEELTAYFEENKANYRTDPLRKVHYLKFAADEFKDKVEVGDNEVQDYFEANPDEFVTAATVEARHILIKVAEDADETAVEAARVRAAELEDKAKAGEDFAELAKTFSEGPSKDQGGFLGAFQREQMVKPFADQAFSMAPGEISAPVRTQFGWHVIKVEKSIPESRQALADATDQIRTQLTTERATSQAYDLAEEIYEEAFEDDNLAAIAEARQLTVQTADFFPRQGPVAGIADGGRFAATAFELPLNVIGEVVEFSDGYYLLQVTEEQPAADQALEDVRDKVKTDLLAAEQKKMATSDAQACLKSVTDGLDLAAAGEVYGLSPVTTVLFQRRGSIPDLGFESAISAAAFKLTAEQPLAAEVIQGSKGVFVIRLQERQLPTAEAFESAKTATMEQLQQRKTQQLLAGFADKLREGSQIELNLELDPQ